MAWQGKARQGKARQGKARQGKARQGERPMPERRMSIIGSFRDSIRQVVCSIGFSTGFETNCGHACSGYSLLVLWMLQSMVPSYRCLWREHFFTRTLILQSSSRNRSPTPDLVFLRLMFTCVFLSWGVSFSQIPVGSFRDPLSRMIYHTLKTKLCDF